MVPAATTAYICWESRLAMRSKARSARKTGSVREKRVRNSQGELVRVLALDANSTTFIDDLTTVFQRNVARARRENLRLLGSADGLPAKK
jgi:hypothetical protein